MASRSSPFPFWPAVTLVCGLLLFIIALPNAWKPWAPLFLKPELQLGLDLAGGTQLDFRISEDELHERKQKIRDEIEMLKAQGNSTEVNTKELELLSLEEQHRNIVEAIRVVLERRIDSLGVKEMAITPSYFGAEKHLLVDCPGVIDVQKCITTVGKTIQLEFKEEFSGSMEEYEKNIRAEAERVFRSVTTGTGNLQVAGQDMSSRLGVSYFDASPLFISALPAGLEALANRNPESPVMKSEATIQTVVEDANGQPQVREVKGIYLTKILEGKKPMERALEDPTAAYEELQKKTPGAILEKKTSVDLSSVAEDLRTPLQTMDIGSEQVVTLGLQENGLLYLRGRVEGKEEMTASHILVQYAGSVRAEPSVTRSREEAKERAETLLEQVRAGENFSTIASRESDGESKEKAGSLGVLSPGIMGSSFDTVAFALEQGEISEVVETPFGFHVIRADKASSVTSPQVTYDLLRLQADADTAKTILEQVKKGEVKRADEQIIVRSIFFSLEPTGWQDTDLNGEHFRSASVTVDTVTNVPVVQILFDTEGGKLFQELTKRNIGKRLAIFVGGESVSEPTVNEEIIGGSAVISGSRTFEEARTLAQDLNTGAIPAPIYLSGQSTVEATLGDTAFQESIFAAAIGLLVLCLFLIVLYRALGVVASLALLFYVVILVAMMKLPLFLVTNQHVVLSLAGIAGMILSMGMAVDANVLTFERIQEELKKGKLLKSAIDTGYKKAWPSVRDGNTSTLITSAILFMIGTSIIRGFAVTLALGIFMSLFTSMIVSKWLAKKLAESAVGKRPEMFGIKTDRTDKFEA